jgi:hypothetical protein
MERDVSTDNRDLNVLAYEITITGQRPTPTGYSPFRPAEPPAFTFRATLTEDQALVLGGERTKGALDAAFAQGRKLLEEFLAAPVAATTNGTPSE